MTGDLSLMLEKIYEIIEDRKRHPRSDSYVSSLFEKGHDQILRKVLEEASEVLLASKNNTRPEIIYEVADLFFHTLVLLGYHEISLEEISHELARRFGHSGLREK
ncbi:MAG: phosphoribosyl-ATP diphosphatase [Candidatus Tectomicrobia bacterium]|nr:phosphoribosyl-ATP diphosphatase [Candidatus Tectomicrobia bacterium]